MPTEPGRRNSIRLDSISVFKEADLSDFSWILVGITYVNGPKSVPPIIRASGVVKHFVLNEHQVRANNTNGCKSGEGNQCGVN
jgi:hypothetical protein